MKTCRVCKEDKELKEFYAHPDYRDGRMNQCKACLHDRYVRNRGKIPVKKVDWYIFD